MEGILNLIGVPYPIEHLDQVGSIFYFREYKTFMDMADEIRKSP
jgi:hypothetical protein